MGLDVESLVRQNGFLECGQVPTSSRKSAPRWLLTEDQRLIPNPWCRISERENLPSTQETGLTNFASHPLCRHLGETFDTPGGPTTSFPSLQTSERDLTSLQRSMSCNTRVTSGSRDVVKRCTSPSTPGSCDSKITALSNACIRDVEIPTAQHTWQAGLAPWGADMVQAPMDRQVCSLNSLHNKKKSWQLEERWSTQCSGNPTIGLTENVGPTADCEALGRCDMAESRRFPYQPRFMPLPKPQSNDIVDPIPDLVIPDDFLAKVLLWEDQQGENIHQNNGDLIQVHGIESAALCGNATWQLLMMELERTASSQNFDSLGCSEDHLQLQGVESTSLVGVNDCHWPMTGLLEQPMACSPEVKDTEGFLEDANWPAYDKALDSPRNSIQTSGSPMDNGSPTAFMRKHVRSLSSLAGLSEADISGVMPDTLRRTNSASRSFTRGQLEGSKAEREMKGLDTENENGPATSWFTETCQVAQGGPSKWSPASDHADLVEATPAQDLQRGLLHTRQNLEAFIGGTKRDEVLEPRSLTRLSAVGLSRPLPTDSVRPGAALGFNAPESRPTKLRPSLQNHSARRVPEKVECYAVDHRQVRRSQSLTNFTSRPQDPTLKRRRTCGSLGLNWPISADNDVLPEAVPPARLQESQNLPVNNATSLSQSKLQTGPYEAPHGLPLEDQLEQLAKEWAGTPRIGFISVDAIPPSLRRLGYTPNSGHDEKGKCQSRV